MRLSKSEREKQKQEAVDYLRSILPAGSTVYTVLMSTSRSGMSRTIKVLVSDVTYQKNGAATYGAIMDISHFVARALESRYKDGMSGGVMVGGAGMDMGYHLVSSLARVLFGYIDPSEDALQTNCYGLNHRWL